MGLRGEPVREFRLTLQCAQTIKRVELSEDRTLLPSTDETRMPAVEAAVTRASLPLHNSTQRDNNDINATVISLVHAKQDEAIVRLLKTSTPGDSSWMTIDCHSSNSCTDQVMGVTAGQGASLPLQVL
jgi:hypothetical protein